MVLPAGTQLPGVGLTLALGVAAAAVTLAARRVRPRVDARVVQAAVPWMVLGATLHVAWVTAALPAWLAPIGALPAVYVAVALAAAAVLTGVSHSERPAALTAVVGLAATVVVLGWWLTQVQLAGPARLALLAGTLLAALVATVGVVGAIQRVWGPLQMGPAVATVVVGGHLLDAASTAVGVDLLGYTERTPLSQLLLEAAAALPGAPTVGVTWLFVLVKLALVVVIIRLFDPGVREAPTQTHLLLVVVAAVGLGPGVHNLLLYLQG